MRDPHRCRRSGSRVSLLLVLACCAAGCPGMGQAPTEQELLTRFRTQNSDLDRVRAAAKGLPEGCAVWADAVSCSQFPWPRQQEPRDIAGMAEVAVIREVMARQGFRRVDRGHGYVEVLVFTWGLLERGVTAGYCYVDGEENDTIGKLEERGPTGPRRLKGIEGGWYLWTDRGGKLRRGKVR